MNSIWIALSYIKGIGPKRIKKLYTELPNLAFTDFKGPKLDKIIKIVGNKKLSESLSDIELIEKNVLKAEESIRLHANNNISVVTISDHNYPELLKKIDDSPIALYCKGNLDLLKTSKSIAVVGTRNPTSKGEKMASRISKVFSEKGYVIVSGLALGIDTAAHVGTLEANGKTIAILANGLDTIVPKENKKLAEEIIQKEGLLISEYPMKTRTFRAAFVQRDRIQSGMSIAVCPVQTDIEGGTQHTISFARKQKRILFCPTPLEQVAATRGISKLLNEGVLPINNSQDIVTIEKSISKGLLELMDADEIEVEVENGHQLDLFD